jgi:hypothetical protein
MSSTSKKRSKTSGSRSNEPIGTRRGASASAGRSLTSSKKKDEKSGFSSDPRKSTHSGSNLNSSNPSVNEAWGHPEKLIPMSRNMLDNAAAFPKQFVESDLELNNITAGQIADLCHLQHRATNCGENIPGGNIAYTPLNPYRMSTKVEVISSETERMDARIDYLKENLQQFGGAS